MTHEQRPNTEARYGPEHQHDLPDAADIPTFDRPADAFAHADRHADLSREED